LDGYIIGFIKESQKKQEELENRNQYLSQHAADLEEELDTSTKLNVDLTERAEDLEEELNTTLAENEELTERAEQLEYEAGCGNQKLWTARYKYPRHCIL
jgi:phage shock protein A